MNVPLPGISEPHDLRELFRATVSGGVVSAPRAAGTWRRTVEVIEPGPVEVAGPALPVGSGVDGVQARLELVWRGARDPLGGRPAFLDYVAAAAYGYASGLRAVHEELALVSSYMDEVWSRGLPTAVTRVVLDGHDAQSLLLQDGDRVDALRRRFELAAVRAAAALGQRSFVVIDGDLQALGHLPPNVVAVAKTMETQLLADERGLATLPVGWRSPAFVKWAGTRELPHVVSSYLRLHPTHGPVEHGLVRLEVARVNNAVELLDRLAAYCLSDRQAPRSEPRWDTHLRLMRRTEDALRARRPDVFTIMSGAG